MLETFSTKGKGRLKGCYTLIPTPLGWLGVVAGGQGIIALLRGRDPSRLRRSLRRRYVFALEKEEAVLHQARRFLENYFKGRTVAPPHIDLSSKSSFQKRVLYQVKKIPYGKIRTYDWIAKRIRSHSGARACGQALHQNPLPLFVPCHRVIRKSGEWGGFIWGKRIKGRLLRLETRKEKSK